MEEIQLALTNPNELTLDHKSNGEQCDCVPQADEMHDQYLNRLEASFITQLHQSTGWLARWPNRSVNRNLPANQQKRKASEQFTVFRDGCWVMINFRRATTTDS
ncbi:hypothetical protein LIER_16732 [Lithospermum erythrorhizon]|uniref:Uncharacterized protein n=1 Tax=Lithospermum erythrorhizon TaxID=34254 RepID=A0AAV3QBX0_LITER